MTQPDLFANLPEMPMLTTRASKIEFLLRYFAQQKLPLAVVADYQHLDRSLDTLRRYAREMNLTFPDYTPRHLKGAKDEGFTEDDFRPLG